MKRTEGDVIALITLAGPYIKGLNCGLVGGIMGEVPARIVKVPAAVRAVG